MPAQPDGLTRPATFVESLRQRPPQIIDCFDTPNLDPAALTFPTISVGEPFLQVIPECGDIFPFRPEEDQEKVLVGRDYRFVTGLFSVHLDDVLKTSASQHVEIT